MIENLLTTFRECFPMTRVNCYPDMLVYKTRRGLAKSLAEAANEIINEHGWPLTAIPTSLSAQDSVVIQSSEVEL